MAKQKGVSGPLIDKISRYRQLLTAERLKPSSEQDIDLAAFSDKSRILHSAPFQRLQSKAQVFSMARTATVRTRLTHSLEVGNYGQLIAEALARKLVDANSLPPELRFVFVQTAENACLIHDIGNPPFGHMGEYAISEWFSSNGDEIEKRWRDVADITSHLKAYSRFDGNPHGFRIVTRLQWLSDEYGMNLTCSLLASCLKYLGPRSHFTKKDGYFPSETPTVKAVWQSLGLRPDDDGLPLQRHPLSFIMEAADDIAYCLSDIEDAIEKRVVTQSEFVDWMREHDTDVGEFVRKAGYPQPNNSQRIEAEECKKLMPNSTFHFFRLVLSRQLVERAVAAYLRNENKILDGSVDKSLFDTDDEAKRWLDLLKAFSRSRVYRSRLAIETELAGLNAIKGLLSAYKDIMLLTREEFKSLKPIHDNAQTQEQQTPALQRNTDSLTRRPILSLLYSLLPQKHVLAYECASQVDAALEPVYRTQLVVDYIAGMTDSHVLKIYNMVNGSQQFGLE